MAKSLVTDVWSILGPAQKRQVLAAQGISLLMALSTVTGIAAIAPFFAVLGNPQLIDRYRLLHWLYLHGAFPGKRAFVMALGFAFIAAVLLSNLINALGSMAMTRIASGIGDQLQVALFDEYLSRPYAFYACTHTATLFNNVVWEIRRLGNGILQNVFLMVTNAFTGALIILSVLLLNPLISITMLLGLAGGYALIYSRVRKRLLDLGRRHSRACTEQAKIVNESLGAIKEVLLLQDRGVFSREFEHTTGSVSQTACDIHHLGQIPKHIMECLAVTALVGIALLLNGGDWGGGVWLGELTFVAFAAYRLLPILQQVYLAAVRVGADRAGFELIAPDLRLARATAARARTAPPAAQTWWQERPREEILLKGLSFQYANDRPPALAGVDLRIPAGAIVGLVGANGSGKTTLVDLIAGLLAPTAGKVQVDGVEINDANRAAWRARIAYVPQNIFLLDASVAQNIAFGIPPDAIDPRRLSEAARLAQLETLIGTLPGGFNHRVGERGVALSGGQRQRIGIARALYRDRAVLLLDEATSALDDATETELMEALGGLRGRYTVILIAHGPRVVRACDVVFELENGTVRDCGYPRTRTAAR
ncbi:MAG TPA: ABC transporter ATP-binding protein [Steroidobacteraceae bacterium]|nr:ABC transporter ATP-binding protein [Steroidobacteraceae bacterium]